MAASAPRPPAPRDFGGSTPRPESTSPSTAKARKNRSSERSKASPLPMAMAAWSVALGVFVLVLMVQTPSAQTLGWGLTGYVLAGFVPPLLLGWDSASQRRGLKNPNFSAKRGYQTALRVIVLVGILAAIFHLLTIADGLALRLSEWLFTMGVMTP